jgi:GTP-binding protein EngB required for normal cell division
MRKRSPRRKASPRTRSALPTVTEQKAIENESRAIFRQAVSPWLVTDFTEHDYGIDAIVEITRPRLASKDLDATSQRFAVQLKATNESVSERNAVSVRVRPEHINYWLDSTEPVLLVLCDVPHKTVYTRWIDHRIVDELTRRDPSWIGQGTIAVSVPTNRALDADGREELARAVSQYRRSKRRLLSPGLYEALQTRLSTLAIELAKCARATTFQSVAQRLVDLEATVRTSTYVVALTGPARAGKSTLLNALIGRDLSPVGRLPTTSVSMVVRAGARDEAEVVLAGGARVNGPASAQFLEQYATQDQNPDNVKGVQMVAVRLVDELLERGVAYVDAPGLHDPSATIRAVTETALRAAHAIVYVLDVAPAREGGFSINMYHVNDLTQLRSAAERLFVVLNKADVLTDDQRAEVLAYVEATLRKYNLWDSLPVPPMFIAARAGWEWQRTGRRGESPLVALDKAIWQHLLETHSAGIDRLTTSVTELHRAGSELVTLLAARQMRGGDAFRLRESLQLCRSRGHELVTESVRRRRVIERSTRGRLENECQAICERLRSRLEETPLDENLPANERLVTELEEQMLRLLDESWREASTKLASVGSFVSQEVEKSLRQARLMTGAPDELQFVLPPVPRLTFTDTLPEAWFGLFSGGFLGLLFVGGLPVFALAAAGWLAGVILGRGNRRKRDIARLVRHAHTLVSKSANEMHVQMCERIAQYMRSLERHVTDRIAVFVHDVENQLEKLDTPVSPDEQMRLKELEQSTRHAIATLTDVSRELGVVR